MQVHYRVQQQISEAIFAFNLDLDNFPRARCIQIKPGMANFTAPGWISDMDADRLLELGANPSALCHDSPTLTRPCRVKIN